ncbi:TolC family outer membrane protein [Aquabacterium sp.]|uniref:TolC family outer membrane protein n=1 Tax=Aquabacterium sp. TaxID=1872578 RepID=UPI002C96AB7E|nr:TolC family outer membrane protein [Aquabacterium sp.]HSW07360.1 TolC family outer membrane protein [Aquabacterium sp.]
MFSLNLRPTTPRLTILALALVTMGATAQAQSLKELYDAARAYDATYLAAKALADSAQYKAAQADALRLPGVTLEGSGTTTKVDPVAGQNLTTNTQSVAVQARQPLFNRANTATIAQAERALQVSRADLETAEQDLIVRVAQAYFDVLASQDSLGTAQTSKKAIAEQLASAKRNFEVGTATITDTREAQARFDLATAQEIAADNDLRTKRIVLDQLVGKTGIAPKPLAVPVALPAVSPANAEEWVTLADDRHPGILRARLAQEVAKLETEKAQAGKLPTVDLIGSVGGSHNTGSGVTATGSRPGTSKNATIGVQMNYTLFSGGFVQNRIKETLVLEEKARNDLEAARRGVAQGTRQAYFGVQSLQAQVKALEAAESSSKLALEATQLGYRVGVRVNLDVLNAQTQLFTTQRDLSKARYDVVLNSLKLRQASGQLQPQDVQAVDALLAR